MLCKKIKKLGDVSLDNYYANLKYDGERIIAVKGDNKVVLWNRRGVNKTEIYPEITKALQELPQENFIIDGEVISQDGDFNDLQRRALLRNKLLITQRVKALPVRYMVFDILSLNKEELVSLPLSKRKDILGIFKNNFIEPTAYLEGDAILNLWDYVIANDKEGIILKVKDSSYHFKRSCDWLKLKNFKEEIIEFNAYEINNAGVKLSDGFYEVQVAQQDKVDEIKAVIDSGQKVKVNVQYLEKTEKGKLRFPSCKEVLI